MQRLDVSVVPRKERIEANSSPRAQFNRKVPLRRCSLTLGPIKVAKVKNYFQRSIRQKGIFNDDEV